MRPEAWVVAAVGSGVALGVGLLLYRGYARRLASRRETERQRLIDEAHSQAMAEGQTGYFDPETGLFVFTALQHLNRGYCCGSGCRHCPYDHVNVPANKAAAEAAEAAAKKRTSLAASRAKALTKSPIFTRTGDRGITSLSSGERRSKDHPVIVVMGDLDELNSQIGLAKCTVARHQEADPPHPDEKARYSLLARQLEFVQHKIFDVGGSCGSAGDPDRTKKAFKPDDVAVLEEWIEDLTDYLPNIASFIVPAGGPICCHLHVARCVCRRAERSMVLLNGVEGVDPTAMQFVNRLSDFLFAAARLAHHLEGQPDIPVRRNAVWDDEQGTI